MTKRFGFTLAEVLITLGIIGVVAAMTIPTLINSTNQQEFKSGIKKAVSVLNQAVTMNVALNSQDFGTLTSGSTAGTSIYGMFTSRMNVVSTSAAAVATLGPVFNAVATNYTLFFNDGMVVQFPQAAASCTTQGQAGCTIVVDLNGNKKPNALSTATTTGSTITDEFVFDFFSQQVVPHDNASRYLLYN